MGLPLRLSVYWFFGTGALGIYFPYLPLYLRENLALSGAQVGAIMAIPPMVGIVAQPLWGQLADRTGSRTRVLALLCACSGLGYCGLTLASGFATMALAVFALAVFVSSIIPMATAVSMAGLSESGTTTFGHVRVWGTVGYLIAVVAAPRVLDAFQASRGLHAIAGGPSEPGLEYAFFVGCALIWAAAWAALGLKGGRSLTMRAQAGDYRQLLRNRGYLRVLAFNFGGYFFIHGPMILFPVYVRSRGGDMADLSNLWVWMLLLEVPLVAFSGGLFERLGARRMLALAVLAGGVRWVACARGESIDGIAAFQLLHAVVITGLIVGAALYVERLVPDGLRSTAQSGLSMLSALGGILSATLGGALLDHSGIDAVYWVGGVGALLWGGAGMLLLPRTTPAARVSVSPAPL